MELAHGLSKSTAATHGPERRQQNRSGQFINHRTMEGSNMADDRMKNADLDKNLEGAKRGEGGRQGQESPSRNPTDDQSAGQRGGHGNQPHRGGQNAGSREDINRGGSNR